LHLYQLKDLAVAQTGATRFFDQPPGQFDVALLDWLVDSGKSVIVIEHHQAVTAHADWIIDLGPSAGQVGGRVVFEGTPADLVTQRSTLTGHHLAGYMSTG